jgi:cell division protein FtsZ
VTIPFIFEGRVQMGKALLGVEEMRKNVDALLVINNQRLFDLYSDGITKAEEAFAKADEIVTIAAKSISEIITMEGIVSRDFCDVQTVMKDGGDAIMSVGRANGEHRIEKAFIDALKSPLLNNVKIEKARRLLYIIYSSDEHQATISELSEINLFMEDLATETEVLWGLYRDNSLNEDVKVTLIATDFEEDGEKLHQTKETDEKSKRDALIQSYYGDLHKQLKKENTTETTNDTPNTSKEEEECTIIPEPSEKEQQKATFLGRFIKKLEGFMNEME